MTNGLAGELLRREGRGSKLLRWAASAFRLRLKEQGWLQWMHMGAKCQNAMLEVDG